MVKDHSPSSQYNIPFLRNRRFVGRSVVLEDLKQRLFVNEECQKMAIVGLGGIGKTQVALEFAYQVKEVWPEYSIFWIPALSMESLEQAYGDIARKSNLPRSAEAKKDVKELVKEYLSNETAGKWLLVVDNADDMDLLLGTEDSKGIADYLPQSENGLTVFTSRYQEVAVSLAVSDIIEVGEMNRQEAADFLEKSLVRKQLLNDKETTNELLEELTYLPLAIAQAAAYLNRNKNMSFIDYLKLQRNTAQDIINLLSYEFYDATRYESTQYRKNKTANAIARTWLVSFDQIQVLDSKAADLLTFMSCIEYKAIPRSILPPIQPDEQMTRAIGTLCAYSFLERRGNEEIYDMHRLVHLSTRIWIEKHNILIGTAEEAIRHVSKVFPYAKFANQSSQRIMLIHALRLLGGKQGEELAERYTLCLKVGVCLREEGRTQEAIKQLEESYKWRKRNLAEEHPNRLTSQFELTDAYLWDGQIKKAVELLERTVAVRERTLAEDHPDLLDSQYSLAIAYRWDGQIKKAVKLAEQVLSVRERTLSEDHPDRLESQYSLGNIYIWDGQIKKAVKLLEHVVAARERMLAEDHPNRLASQLDLAVTYRLDGQVKKAVKLLEHVVTVRERTLAEDHPNRLVSQHGLAIAYQSDGQIKKAVELLEHVDNVGERVLAKDHPSRLDSQFALASVYRSDGQIKKAVKLLEYVVAARERMFAEDHPNRLGSQNGLAMAYQSDGQIKKAIELLEHVVTVRERTLAEDHPDRLGSQHNLASVYRSDGQIKKAIELLEHVVALRERTLAEDHPDRLRSQLDLADVYQSDGQYQAPD